MHRTGIGRRAALRGAAALGLAGALAPAAWGQAAGLIPAADPRLQFEGRTAEVSPGVLRLAYSGIVLRLRAHAARIVLRYRAASPDCYLDVAVDGGPVRKVRLAKGEGTLELANGPAAAHAVEITRRTESWMGVLDILGVEVSGGRLELPPPLPPRKLLFVGDSITVGVGTDAGGSMVVDQPPQCDGRLSYGRVLARRLDAQAHLVAYGGRGVIRDFQGSRALPAPVFYERALPDDPHSHWDFSRYAPQAVGICLGTNDFNQGMPEEAEFVNAYVQFIEKIGRDAPGAAIFVIDSPIVQDDPEKGPRGTVLKAYLDEVVRLADSPWVKRAHVRHYPGRTPVDGHPTGPEHEQIATELEPLFRAALKV